MQENARRIRVANRLSLLGCLGGFLLYFTAYLPSDDWRGLGVAAGLAAGLPFLWLIASSISGGAKNVRECLIAYTMSQKALPPILLGLIILCIAGGIVSAASLIINPPPTPSTEHRSVAPQVQAISGGGSDGGRVVN